MRHSSLATRPGATATRSSPGPVLGSTPRNRKLNQFTGRIDHNITPNDVLFGSFISNHDQRTEPTLQSNNLHGYGDFRPATRYLVALGYTHVIQLGLKLIF